MTGIVLVSVTLLCAGAGLIVATVYWAPKCLIRWAAKLYPSVVFAHWKCLTASVALTIDDAPSPATDEILDVLKQFEVKATFFVIGEYAASADGQRLVRRMLAEGHEIGNHGMKDEPAIKLSNNALTASIHQTEAILMRAGWEKPQARHALFRPGSGMFNQAMLHLANGLGYNTILGSVYPHDPRCRNARCNQWHIATKAGPGDIIVIHDRDYTAGMLRQLLPVMQQKGYNLGTVAHLFQH